MEINVTTAAPETGLDGRRRRLAGVTSILAGLAVAGVSLASALSHWSGPTEVVILPIAWMLLFALTVVAGANLIRGCIWSQRLLLAFWLATMIVSLVLGMMWLLWGVPPWWTGFTTVPPVAVLAPLGAVSLLQSVLLVMATAANTRARYGAMVTVSVAIAAGLVLTVNLIAQKDPYHKDLETLGQYGLSERTKRILATINEPVQMTVVYTGSDKDRRGADFRENVLELGQEMQREMVRLHKPAMKVVNVTGDGERAMVLSRLSQQSASAAPLHKEALDKFAATADALLAEIDQQEKAWQALPAESYVGLWGMPAIVADRLDIARQEITRVRGEVAGQLSRSVPDMAGLTTNVAMTLKDTRENFQKIAQQLEKIAKVPPAVAANKAAALKSLEQSHQAVKDMIAVLGKPDSAAPADPTATLKKFAAAARKASDLLTATGKALSEIAGKDNVKLLSQSSIWGDTRIDPRTQMPTRTNLGDVYTMWGKSMQEQASESEDAAASLKPEVQAKYVMDARKQLADIGDTLDKQLGVISQAIDKLAAPDAASAAIFKQAAENKALAGLLDPLAGLIARFDKLPELKASTLGSDAAGENVVVLEMGDKAEVLPFDAVWPPKFRGELAAGDAADKRVFNGDSVIGTRLLTMSQERPFATVYLTYVAPPLPPQMAQMRMNPNIEPWNTIASRLREANFAVKEWNLNEAMPSDGPATTTASSPATQADKLPRVLLILPTPPATRVMPNPYAPPQTDFTALHVEKIRRELSGNTSAMLLAYSGFSGADELLSYFKNEWGADVQSNYMIFAGIADESQAGQFLVDIRRLSWLPLNNFAAQPPIGLPLRSQRVLWRALCPIAKTPVVAAGSKAPRSVEYQPLLAVPKVRDIWAMSKENVQQAETAIFSRTKDTVAPAEGDILAPFDVAVALTGKGDSKENRVVISSMGASLVDQYLAMPIEDKPGKFIDPPKADADFVPNAVYWLIGRPEYIGSGPAVIRPVEISESEMKIVWPVVVIVLPLVLLGVGGLVMLMRRTR